jgi:hypothetical protein
MNFNDYLFKVCSSITPGLPVSTALCTSTNFSKDNWVTNLFLSRIAEDFHNFSQLSFLADDILNILFIKDENRLYLSTSSPFQTSFRGNFFASGVATEGLANLIFFLNVF